jgi:hypothetical protein
MVVIQEVPNRFEAINGIVENPDRVTLFKKSVD